MWVWECESISSRNLHAWTYPLHRAVALLRKKSRLIPQFNESGSDKINPKQIGKFDILVSGWYCGKDTVLLILTYWYLISYRLELEPWFIEWFYSRDERSWTSIERTLVFVVIRPKMNEHGFVAKHGDSFFWKPWTRTNTNTCSVAIIEHCENERTRTLGHFDPCFEAMIFDSKSLIILARIPQRRTKLVFSHKMTQVPSLHA